MNKCYLFLFVMVTLYACTPQETLLIADVSTGEITNITTTTANCSGNVIADRGFSVAARGICWNISGSPTISDFRTIDGTGLGTFTSNLSDLLPNTTYYVRAYATNSEGTAYGEEKSFTTLFMDIEYGSFTDSRDGNQYETVTIGSQVWMAENLAYLPAVNALTTSSSTEPHYYVYGYNGTDIDAAKATTKATNIYTTYGVLYNWPAALTACPEGWHLPTDAEWTTLTDYLGGEDVAGGKMKEAGTQHWINPNIGATNACGFTTLPGGCLTTNFYDLNYGGYFWSSSVNDIHNAWYISLSNYNTNVSCASDKMHVGFSVRCVKDNFNTQPTVVTGWVNNITFTTATCVGFVTSTGGNSVTASGVCWSTSENPTISNSKTTDGAALGTYTSHITGLSPNTTYYVRTYATNAKGTSYGQQRSFITYNTLTDSRDGNIYKTVSIGDQVWMAENLAYLPEVSPSSSGSYDEPYYYVFGYESTNVSAAKATTNYTTYGVLYNWPAAMNGASSSNSNPSGVQGICPDGWHLPSDEEWTQLENYLISNGYNYDGTTTGNKIAISLASATGWEDAYNSQGAIGNKNTAYDAYRNKSGFSALPGGYRSYDGGFGLIGLLGFWWSSTEYSTNNASDRSLSCTGGGVGRSYGGKDYGFSVRCLRD